MVTWATIRNLRRIVFQSWAAHKGQIEFESMETDVHASVRSIIKPN
jgi:hypothetical protein